MKKQFLALPQLFPLFLFLFLFLFLSSAFAFESDHLTFSQTLELMKNLGITKIKESVFTADDSVDDENDSRCLGRINEKTSKRYQTLIKTFRPKLLGEQLLTAWAQSEKNRRLKIEVHYYPNGIKSIFFDEGLIYNFTKEGWLREINHWRDYNLNATAAYNSFFNQIPGFNSWYEMTLYFEGPCKGNVLF